MKKEMGAQTARSAKNDQGQSYRIEITHRNHFRVLEGVPAVVNTASPSSCVYERECCHCIKIASFLRKIEPSTVCDGRSHRSYFHLLSNRNFFDTHRGQNISQASLLLNSNTRLLINICLHFLCITGKVKFNTLIVRNWHQLSNTLSINRSPSVTRIDGE
jgi:hypothetical protein